MACSDRSVSVAGCSTSMLALGLVKIVTLAIAGFAVSIALLAGASPVPGSMLWPWVIAVPGVSLPAVGLLVYARRRAQAWGSRVQTLADHGWLLMRMLGELSRLPQAWCGIGLYFIADIVSLYAATRAVGLRLGVAAVLIAYASGYLFTRRTLPLASAAFVEVLLTFSLFWVGASARLCYSAAPRGSSSSWPSGSAEASSRRASSAASRRRGDSAPSVRARSTPCSR
jgi:hypothetical protein